MMEDSDLYCYEDVWRASRRIEEGRSIDPYHDALIVFRAYMEGMVLAENGKRLPVRLIELEPSIAKVIYEALEKAEKN